MIHYAAEILRRAWDKTGDARYLAGIEERAAKMLDVRAASSPTTWPTASCSSAACFRPTMSRCKGNSAEAAQLLEANQASSSSATNRPLRSSQREDGAWGFSPGQVDRTADPSPTALAIDALVALGADADDPAVARGVQALLAMQHPYGLWNRSAKTGFVTTSYVLHTLSRLFPDAPPKLSRKDFEPQPDESLHDTIARMRLLAHLDPWSAAATEEPPEEYLDLMLAGATHASPHVRYWAMIALGARHSEAAVPALIEGLSDPVKMVREAARWGLRQTLLDDHGWDAGLCRLRARRATWRASSSPRRWSCGPTPSCPARKSISSGWPACSTG